MAWTTIATASTRYAFVRRILSHLRVVLTCTYGPLGDGRGLLWLPYGYDRMSEMKEVAPEKFVDVPGREVMI